MNKLFKRISSLAAVAVLLIATVGESSAQQEVRWLRNPAISPDGSQIVFGYMGNLYKVSSDGGQATAITSGDNYCGYPVWSRDGKMIAYASDLYGNFDVFVMPAGGGVPVRLTYSSTADYPFDFTPDGKYVLFGSGRFAPAESIRFPSCIAWASAHSGRSGSRQYASRYTHQLPSKTYLLRSWQLQDQRSSGLYSLGP